MAEKYSVGASIFFDPPLNTIEGLPQKIFSEALPFAIRAATQFVRRRVRFYTPFRTGKLQAGWTDIQQSGAGDQTIVTFENEVPYGPIIEFGLYPATWIHPGGLLMFGPGGGVYTRKKFKAPGGMLTPILANEGEDIQKVATTALNRILRQVSAQKG